MLLEFKIQMYKIDYLTKVAQIEKNHNTTVPAACCLGPSLETNLRSCGGGSGWLSSQCFQLSYNYSQFSLVPYSYVALNIVDTLSHRTKIGKAIFNSILVYGTQEAKPLSSRPSKTIHIIFRFLIALEKKTAPSHSFHVIYNKFFIITIPVDGILMPRMAEVNSVGVLTVTS